MGTHLASRMSSGLNRLLHFFSVSANPTMTSSSPRGSGGVAAVTAVAVMWRHASRLGERFVSLAPPPLAAAPPPGAGTSRSSRGGLGAISTRFVSHAAPVSESPRARRGVVMPSASCGTKSIKSLVENLVGVHRGSWVEEDSVRNRNGHF